MAAWAMGAVAVQTAAFDVGVDAGRALLVALAARNLLLGGVRLMALEAVLVVLWRGPGRDLVAFGALAPLLGGVRLVTLGAVLVALAYDLRLVLVAFAAWAPLLGAVRLVTATAVLVALAYDLRPVLVAETARDLVASWLVRDRAPVTPETVLVSLARADGPGVGKRVRGVTTATESCRAGPEIELVWLVAIAANRSSVVRSLVKARVGRCLLVTL